MKSKNTAQGSGTREAKSFTTLELFLEQLIAWLLLPIQLSDRLQKRRPCRVMLVALRVKMSST